VHIWSLTVVDRRAKAWAGQISAQKSAAQDRPETGHKNKLRVYAAYVWAGPPKVWLPSKFQMVVGLHAVNGQYLAWQPEAGIQTCIWEAHEKRK
jgi:hypothetical protein